MNIWDILIGGLVAGALLVALFFMNKNQDGCSGSCSSCSMSGTCHKEEKE